MRFEEIAVPLHRVSNMRRIAYIAPIDYIAGSICARQDFEYSTAENDAWSATTSTISPDAYKPILVAARRKQTGSRYFWVKSRTTTRLSAANRLSLASFGAAAAKYNVLIHDASAKATLETIYNAVRHRVTFRNFVFPALRTMYAGKYEHTDITDGTHTITIYNDFIASGTVGNPLPAGIKSKFMNVLSI